MTPRTMFLKHRQCFVSGGTRNTLEVRDMSGEVTLTRTLNPDPNPNPNPSPNPNSKANTHPNPKPDPTLTLPLILNPNRNLLIAFSTGVLISPTPADPFHV